MCISLRDSDKVRASNKYFRRFPVIRMADGLGFRDDESTLTARHCNDCLIASETQTLNGFNYFRDLSSNS